jgi:hypothetical protein
MSWTDKELDELFKDAASDQSFEYNAAYFKDIEAQLPVNNRKKRGFYWFFGASGLVMSVIAVLLFWNNSATVHSIQSDHSTVESAPVKEKTISQIQPLEGEKSTLNDYNVVNLEKHVNPTVNQIEVTDKKEIQLQISKTEDAAVSMASNEDAAIQTNDVKEQSTEIDNLSTVEVVAQETSTPDVLVQELNMPIRNTKKSGLYIEFNGGIGQSPIQSTENGSSRSVNWGLQAGYIYSKNNWSLSTGLGAGESYFNNIYIKERSTIYGFGVNTYDNQYQFTSLFKLDIPVSFSYRLGSHELNAGLNTSLPLFARVSYTELKDGIENEVSKGVSSPLPYFRKVIFEPTLGYRFALDQHWSIGASLKAQLANPVNSLRVKGDRNLLPLSGQITLRKTFELR